MLESFQKRIAASIKAGDKYAVYKQELLAYKDFLLTFLQKQPGHVQATCQLAIMYLELGDEDRKILAVLKDLLKNYSKQMLPVELVETYTCLAAFYAGQLQQHKKAIVYLYKAIAVKPSALLWEKLGLSYVHCGNLPKASTCFRQAVLFEPNESNQFYHALSLARLEKYDEALDCIPHVCPQADSSLMQHLSYYLRGFCLAKTGRYAQAKEIADKLALFTQEEQTPAYDYIAESEVADIYYLCGSYAQHNKMYDDSKIKYYYDASWLGCYFHSLHCLGKHTQMQQLLAEVKEEKYQTMAFIRQEEYTEQDGGEAARVDYLLSLQKEYDEIASVYKQVVAGTFKAQISCADIFLNDCYYVGCLRHRQEDL